MDRKSASKATSVSLSAAELQRSRAGRRSQAERQRDLLATYLGTLWRHCFGATLGQSRRALHVHFADIECSDKRRVRQRQRRRLPCRPRIGGPLWLKAFVVAVALNMSPSPLGAAPKYNLSFWSNEFGKGSRKPKRSPKAAQKFKNRAYIWESLLWPLSFPQSAQPWFLLRLLQWQLNLCKMPAEMLSLPERAVVRGG